MSWYSLNGISMVFQMSAIDRERIRAGFDRAPRRKRPRTAGAVESYPVECALAGFNLDEFGEQGTLQNSG
jgi:hypothetical protein